MQQQQEEEDLNSEEENGDEMDSQGQWVGQYED